MKARIRSLDLFTQTKDSAKDAQQLCGAVMALIWILLFMAYSIFTIATFDVNTPIVSIQDRDVTTMPGNLELSSMNFSLILLCFYVEIVTDPSGSGMLEIYHRWDCTSSPNFYTLTYGGSNQTMNPFLDLVIQDSYGTATGKNYSFPLTVDLSQLDPSLTFASLLIYAAPSTHTSIMNTYLQFNLTNLQISYSDGSVSFIPSIYYEVMNPDDKEYHYVFQIQDYYINSKSQFSNAKTYYRKVGMTKVFDSLGSTTGFMIKFMINPLAQSTTITYKKYTDLLAVLGGFWTSILGILTLIYVGYWKAGHPMILKCNERSRRKKRDLKVEPVTPGLDESRSADPKTEVTKRKLQEAKRVSEDESP